MRGKPSPYHRIDRAVLLTTPYEYEQKYEYTTMIYALVDPRTNELKYVGKTRKMTARMSMHFSSATNPELEEWFADLKREGLIPAIRILDLVVSHWRYCDKPSTVERYWIYRLLVNGFPLFNRVAGRYSNSPTRTNAA